MNTSRKLAAARRQGLAALQAEENAQGDVALVEAAKRLEAHFRDAYPGINAITLMEIRDPPDERRHDLQPVVRNAVIRKMTIREPDYWDRATLLDLAVLARDQTAARRRQADALAVLRVGWEAERRPTAICGLSARPGRRANWQMPGSTTSPMFWGMHPLHRPVVRNAVERAANRSILRRSTPAAPPSARTFAQAAARVAGAYTFVDRTEPAASLDAVAQRRNHTLRPDRGFHPRPVASVRTVPSTTVAFSAIGRPSA